MQKDAFSTCINFLALLEWKHIQKILNNNTTVHIARYVKRKKIIMGYTHHWNNVNLTDELVEDAVAIVHSTDVELTDDDGYGDPAIVSFAELKFNGIDEDGHETFWLRADADGDFCKTAEKPYDIVVSAVLTAVILQDAGYVASDGTMQDEGWQAGMKFYEQATGKEISPAGYQKIAKALSR